MTTNLYRVRPDHDDIDTLPGEVWAPHPIWPYDVSTLGGVRSLRSGRLVGASSGSGSGPSRNYSRTLPYIYIGGGLPLGNKFVHILVLETFVGPRPNEHDGDHINHNRFDNRLENLRWRRRTANRADTRR